MKVKPNVKGKHENFKTLRVKIKIMSNILRRRDRTIIRASTMTK